MVGKGQTKSRLGKIFATEGVRWKKSVGGEKIKIWFQLLFSELLNQNLNIMSTSCLSMIFSRLFHVASNENYSNILIALHVIH